MLLKNIWKWIQVLDHWSYTKKHCCGFFPCILLPMAPASGTQHYLDMVFSSTDVQDSTWKWVRTKLPQACLALHHLLTPLGFVFSHVLSCVPKTEHILSFFSIYKCCFCGLQHNPCSILVTLKRTSYLLIAKDNNCITGQRGKREWKDKPYRVGMAALSGWDNITWQRTEPVHFS